MAPVPESVIAVRHIGHASSCSAAAAGGWALACRKCGGVVGAGKGSRALAGSESAVLGATLGVRSSMPSEAGVAVRSMAGGCPDMVGNDPSRWETTQETRRIRKSREQREGQRLWEPKESMKVRMLDPLATPPVKVSEDAAGFDITTIKDFELAPGERWLIHTGVAVQLPKGTYGRLASRSGLATRHGITVGSGVSDADFRGEIKVLLFNNGNFPVQFAVGDRVAQI